MINFLVSGKASALLVIFFCSLICCSCLQIEQSLVFHRDGSVVATYNYSMSASLLPALQAAQATLEKKQDPQKSRMTDLNWFLNEKAARDFFTRPGVEVRQYRQRDRDGRRQVQVIILARDGNRAVNTGLFGAMKVQQQEDGRTVLTVEPPGDNQPWSDQQKKSWQQLGEGLQVVFTVSAATPIISSNGQHSTPNSVSWRFTADDTELSLFAPIPTLTATW